MEVLLAANAGTEHTADRDALFLQQGFAEMTARYCGDSKAVNTTCRGQLPEALL